MDGVGGAGREKFAVTSMGLKLALRPLGPSAVSGKWWCLVEEKYPPNEDGVVVDPSAVAGLRNFLTFGVDDIPQNPNG